MKILHTADWHIGQFKGPVEDGVNLRSLDTVKCLEFMVETAREVRPDLVCVSGDFSIRNRSVRFAIRMKWSRQQGLSKILQNVQSL